MIINVHVLINTK